MERRFPRPSRLDARYMQHGVPYFHNVEGVQETRGPVALDGRLVKGTDRHTRSTLERPTKIAVCESRLTVSATRTEFPAGRELQCLPRILPGARMGTDAEDHDESERTLPVDHEAT